MVVGDAVSIADALRLRDQFTESVRRGELDRVTVMDTEQRIQQFLDVLPQHPVQELATDRLRKHAALAEVLAKNAPWSTFQFSPVGFE